jgi:ABC-type molybdate transport system substrate-binding protein
MPKHRILAIATAITLLTSYYTAAAAAELKVLCASELQPAIQELAPAFEKSSGHKLSIQYDTSDKIEQKVAAEEPIDVAILTKPQVDKLVRIAKLVGGSTANLASKGPDLVFVGAAPPYSEQALAAKAFIDFLASPANKPVYKAKGLEPAERASS